MTKLLLKTERLTIRDFEEEDWHAIVQRTTQAEVAAFMPWNEAAWAEQEKVVAWIREQRALDFSTTDRYLEFAVVKDGLNIGDVALKRFANNPKSAEVGWTLDPALQGQGYATEAAAVFMDWCFRNLKLHRLTSVCSSRNTGSYKLMERLGMRREAHHVKSSFIKGEWVDDLVYAVLAEEWSRRPPPKYTVLSPHDLAEKEPA